MALSPGTCSEAVVECCTAVWTSEQEQPLACLLFLLAVRALLMQQVLIGHGPLLQHYHISQCKPFVRVAPYLYDRYFLADDFNFGPAHSVTCQFGQQSAHVI